MNNFISDRPIIAVDTIPESESKSKEDNLTVQYIEQQLEIANNDIEKLSNALDSLLYKESYDELGTILLRKDSITYNEGITIAIDKVEVLLKDGLFQKIRLTTENNLVYESKKVYAVNKFNENLKNLH